jgi:hydrogenase nickel incorporation protein HypA/HybF
MRRSGREVHELAIAESIVAIAREHARGRRVARVEVAVGALRQVVPSALEFAFELVADGTEVEGAELVLEHVDARVACRSCGIQSVCAEFPFACARCRSDFFDVIAGEELHVEALELDDAVSAARR